METPTSDVDGSTTVSLEAAQPYSRRLVSFSAPEQHASLVHVAPMQQQPRAYLQDPENHVTNT